MKTLSLVAALLLLSACASVQKVETAKTTEILGPGVIQNPVIADLDVKEQKVRGTASGRRATAAEVKHMATVNAIKGANADVLVAPVFEMETTGSRTTVTVTGFPATYKNFRHATPADSALVRAGYTQHITTVAVKDTPTRRKNAGWIAGIAATVVGVVVAILAL